VRPAEPKDHFISPYPNETAARASNNGSFPPDQSLIVKARPHGPDYIYALLTGYEDAPFDFSLSEDMYYNVAFSGQQIAMAPPLSEGVIDYPDGTPATVNQMAHDVTAFLAWASDPEAENRRQMGIMVLIFVMIFAGMLCVLNRRTWKQVKGK
jgi:ubiquinol-cytochrome c reductase cytochrome c1 subunit